MRSTLIDNLSIPIPASNCPKSAPDIHRISNGYREIIRKKRKKEKQPYPVFFFNELRCHKPTDTTTRRYWRVTLTHLILPLFFSLSQSLIEQTSRLLATYKTGRGPVSVHPRKAHNVNFQLFSRETDTAPDARVSRTGKCGRWRHPDDYAPPVCVSYSLPTSVLPRLGLECARGLFFQIK